MLVDHRTHGLPIGLILTRGIAAARASVLGALWLFLLYAPTQVLSAVLLGLQADAMAGAGKQPDSAQVITYFAAAGGGLVLALAVFFLFPLVQGGILGQIRDRLEEPHRQPGQLGVYGKAFYARFLGCEALFALGMFVILLPAMCAVAGFAFREIANAAPGLPAEGAAPAPPFDPQQLNRHLLSNPVMLAGVVVASLLASVVGMVYWMSCSIVVAEGERVVPSWRKSVRFCRQNVAAVFVLWLLNVAAGLLVSPLGLLGQLGIVKNVGVLAQVTELRLRGRWKIRT